MKAKRAFLKNLTGLRFLAASYVIAFHFFYFPGHDYLNNFISRGHIAVPFFFLLSGYVLGYSYSDYDFKKNTKKYILGRIIRIAPIYYIGMFLAIPLLIRTNFLVNTIPVTWGSLGQSVILHMAFLQGLFPIKEIMHTWNVHSWSLCVEFFLYIFSPLFLRKISTKGTKTCLIYLVSLITINVGIYFSGVSFGSRQVLNTEVMWQYQPFLYFPIFITGIVLARIYTTNSRIVSIYSNLIFLVSFTFLLFSFIYPFDESFYSSFNPFYQIFFSGLILSSSSSNRLNSFLGSKYFLTLGDASYAMYMFQAPIKLYTQQFLTKVLKFQMNTGFIFASIVFLNIIILSVFITRKVDPKMRALLSQWWIKS